jgi:hypothetical protein
MYLGDRPHLFSLHSLQTKGKRPGREASKSSPLEPRCGRYLRTSAASTVEDLPAVQIPTKYSGSSYMQYMLYAVLDVVLIHSVRRSRCRSLCYSASAVRWKGRETHKFPGIGHYLRRTCDEIGLREMESINGSLPIGATHLAVGLTAVQPAPFHSALAFGPWGFLSLAWKSPCWCHTLAVKIASNLTFDYNSLWPR